MDPAWGGVSVAASSHTSDIQRLQPCVSRCVDCATMLRVIRQTCHVTICKRAYRISIVPVWRPRRLFITWSGIAAAHPSRHLCSCSFLTSSWPRFRKARAGAVSCSSQPQKRACCSQAVADWLLRNNLALYSRNSAAFETSCWIC